MKRRETSARLMRRGQRGVGCRCVACGVVLRKVQNPVLREKRVGVGLACVCGE